MWYSKHAVCNGNSAELHLHNKFKGTSSDCSYLLWPAALQRVVWLSAYNPRTNCQINHKDVF